MTAAYNEYNVPTPELIEAVSPITEPMAETVAAMLEAGFRPCEITHEVMQTLSYTISHENLKRTMKLRAESRKVA